jgi:predicted RNase H-like HicB family nuclease
MPGRDAAPTAAEPQRRRGSRFWRQAHACCAHVEPYDEVMGLQFTAVFRKVPEGYIGYVEELPGANTQGATLAEARTNLREAVEMVLEANRELSAISTQGTDVIREPFKVGA